MALRAVAAGIAHDELLHEALAVFGSKRLTAGVVNRLDSALAAQLMGQRLRDGGRSYTAT